MNHWLTTLLIFLPVAGALLVAVAPLPGYWLGSLAALISLVEIGFWISAAARFDFGDPRLQFQQRHAWFDDLGVSYHVGQYAFSLWLVGATVVVMAALRDLRLVGGPRPGARVLLADAAADGRDRRRLHGAGPAALLRLLRGDADPALRADRRLGRPAAPARDAHVRHLHGRRLAADARVDRRLRAPAGHIRPDAHGHVVLDLALPRLRGGVRDQVAALPVPRLAAHHLPRVPAGGVGGALRASSRRRASTACCGS